MHSMPSQLTFGNLMTEWERFRQAGIETIPKRPTAAPGHLPQVNGPLRRRLVGPEAGAASAPGQDAVAELRERPGTPTARTAVPVVVSHSVAASRRSTGCAMVTRSGGGPGEPLMRPSAGPGRYTWRPPCSASAEHYVGSADRIRRIVLRIRTIATTQFRSAIIDVDLAVTRSLVCTLSRARRKRGLRRSRHGSTSCHYLACG